MRMRTVTGLGTHYEMLPVNRALSPVHHYHKDGSMRFFDAITGNVDAYYEPNSFGGAEQDPSVAEPPLKISGDADRYHHRDGNDDYTQAGNLFRLFDKEQQQRLFTNIAAANGRRARLHYPASIGAFPQGGSCLCGRGCQSTRRSPERCVLTADAQKTKHNIPQISS